MKKRLFASLILAAAMIAAAFPAVILPASAAVSKTATWSSPALCADSGEKIALDSCGVQFEYGKKAVTSGITWKYDGKTVTEFTPDKAGVYPLTAESDGKSRTVYVVAKAPADKEYVLYSDDFSSDPIPGLRVIQKTSGALLTYDGSEKALVLNGSIPSDGYVRVLLPEWLDDFGDAVFTSEFKITSPKTSSRWASMMFRVQNKNIPYYQLAMRYDTTLSNGLEIAQRTQADAWNVVTKGAYSALKDSYRTVTADICGSNISYYVNGTKKLSIKTADFDRGAFGFQVRGVTMTVKSVKIAVNPAAGISGSEEIGYADTRKLKSKVSLGPEVITEIRDASGFDALRNDSPAIAVTDVSIENDAVVLSGKAAADAIASIGDEIIPAFRVGNTEELSRILTFLSSKKITDAYIVSSKPDLLEKAHSAQYQLFEAFEVPADTPLSIEEIRVKAAGAGAGVVILPEGLCTRENVSYLQDRYLCVWERTDGSDAGCVAAVNRGVMGLITDNRAGAEKCLSEYYPANTLTRYTNVIGHRGVPSLAQENSLDSAIKAAGKGACMIENDVQLTKDGVIVIMHDSTIDRTTNGTGSVSSMTLDQLRKFSICVNTDVPAQPIPTLEDYFLQFRDTGKSIVIEYKGNDAKIAEPMAKMIKDFGMEDQIVVISFHGEMLKLMAKHLPGVCTGYLDNTLSLSETSPLRSISEIIPVTRRYATMFSPSYQGGTLGANVVSALQERGITTWIWTVNSQSEFDRYFCMGIRGLTTNYSQWGENYVKELSASQGEDGNWKVSALKYGGKTSDVTRTSEMVTVADGGTDVKFDPQTGAVTGNSGIAKVFFRYTAKTTSGTAYTKVTELVTLDFRSPEEKSAAETTAEPVPGTSPADTTETAASGKGCGSFACFPVAAAAAAAVIIAIKKKKER